MAMRIGKRKKNNVKISFNVSTLNGFIKFILCDYTTKAQIQSIYKLIHHVNIEDYDAYPDIMDRIELIQRLTEVIVDDGVQDYDIIRSHLEETCKSPDLFLKVDLTPNQLSEADVKKVYTMIEERLQCVYIYEADEDIEECFSELRSSNCVSYFSVIKRLKDLLSDLLANLQSLDESNYIIKRFNFSGEDMIDNLDKIVKNAQRPTAILQTGIRQLNAILSPGFYGGRFYVFLGCTGKFKSGTLLNIADQIRLYNPQIKAVENGLRKSILFLTLENSVNETVERLVDMYSGVDDDLRDMTTNQIVELLREQGHFTFTDNDGIDIEIMYFPSLELRVNMIPSIIREMRERGKEPIAIIVDYIDKIESNQYNGGDDRLRIGYAATNLKALANEFNIPVITAMQVNREADALLDAAMRDNKEDLAQLVGSSSVGLCWKLMWEADWTCFVYPERQRSTGQLFLSFRRLKIRGKKKDSRAMDYFNHPFTNEKEIMLACDVMLDHSLSIVSLKSNLENDDINAINAEEVMKNRPRLQSLCDEQKSRVNEALKFIDLSQLEKIT